MHGQCTCILGCTMDVVTEPTCTARTHQKEHHFLLLTRGGDMASHSSALPVVATTWAGILLCRPHAHARVASLHCFPTPCAEASRLVW